MKKKKRVIKEEWIEQSRPENTVTYEYDNKDNITTFCRYLPDGSLNEKQTYRYTYDSRGNWVQCIVTSNVGLARFLVRKLEYY